MNTDQLKQFCSTTNYRLMNPWSEDHYTYATNGHILIRVPRMPEVSENQDASDAAKLFMDFPSEFFDLPEFPDVPETLVCKECRGKPLESHICPECHGNGEVQLENNFNTYVTYCLSCDGDGKINYCDNCDNTGIISNPKTITVKFRGLFLNAVYLKKISALPGIKLATNKKYGCFTFDGGNGLIMRCTE